MACYRHFPVLLPVWDVPRAFLTLGQITKGGESAAIRLTLPKCGGAQRPHRFRLFSLFLSAATSLRIRYRSSPPHHRLPNFPTRSRLDPHAGLLHRDTADG